MADHLAETKMEAHSGRVVKGHLESSSTWNWPQSLNKLKTTVISLESSRRKDLPLEQGKT